MATLVAAILTTKKNPYPRARHIAISGFASVALPAEMNIIVSTVSARHTRNIIKLSLLMLKLTDTTWELRTTVPCPYLSALYIQPDGLMNHTRKTRAIRPSNTT